MRLHTLIAVTTCFAFSSVGQASPRGDAFDGLTDTFNRAAGQPRISRSDVDQINFDLKPQGGLRQFEKAGEDLGQAIRKTMNTAPKRPPAPPSTPPSP